MLIVALLSIFLLASSTNLAAISLKRTHASFRPFQHLLIKTKIFGAAIAVAWITVKLFSFSFVLLKCPSTLTLAFELAHISFISSFSSFFLCFLITLVSYSSIAIQIFFRKQPHCHCATSRERKLTKTLFIVTVVSSLPTVPLIIFRICYDGSITLTPKTILLRKTFPFYSVPSIFFLFHANSLINPNIRNPGFKRALFSFLYCISQTQPAQAFPLDEK